VVEEGLIDLEDTVVLVRHEDGTLEVRQGSSGIGAAAAGGAKWGGLIGLIFLAVRNGSRRRGGGRGLGEHLLRSRRGRKLRG